MQVSLRPWQASDAPALQQNANDPRVAAQLLGTFPSPYTLADAEFFLSLCEKAAPAQDLLLAILANGTVAGGISLTRGVDISCRTAELGYWLGAAHWGKGIATEAVRQVIPLGTARWPLTRIYAEFFETNTASRRVLEKNGFECEGRLRQSIYKNGKVLDALLYSYLPPKA